MFVHMGLERFCNSCLCSVAHNMTVKVHVQCCEICFSGALYIEAVHCYYKSQGQLWQTQSGSLENYFLKHTQLTLSALFCVCVDAILTFIFVSMVTVHHFFVALHI
jgi:hypothetical protein